MATLEDFIDHDALTALIERARDEDLGPGGCDVTSALMDSSNQQAHGAIRARQGGVLAGGALLGAVVDVFDATVHLKVLVDDGQPVTAQTVVAELTGRLAPITKLERTALNFVTHLSGIATLTSQYVQAVKGTNAVICDTRKTIAQMRSLAKYAVACGGGVNHRMGLFDAVLIKDNHIAGIAPDDLTHALISAIIKARAAQPPPAFIEVEVDTLEQLRRVLLCAADMILLDNMSPPQLREAVAMRDADAPQVQLEASGGVTLDNVRAIAESGVDRIAVGQITHSAPALDMGLDIT